MGNAPESMVDPNGMQYANSSFSPNSRQMSGMPEGNGTSYRAFIDAFGGSHSGGGMGDLGGGGGGSTWMGGHTAANGYITQIINRENTKTTQEMIGDAWRTGQTVYNFGVDIPLYIFLGVDEKGNNNYLETTTKDRTVGVYNPQHDPNMGQPNSSGVLSQAGNLSTILGAIGGYMEYKGLEIDLWKAAKCGFRSKPFAIRVGYLTKYGVSIGKVSTALGAISLGNDAISLYNDDGMSWGRFGYHAAAFGGTVGTGYYLGGPYGAVAGVGFGVMEITYDTVVEPYVIQPVRTEFSFGAAQFFRNFFNGWRR
jgi:hypothetical protein